MVAVVAVMAEGWNEEKVREGKGNGGRRAS